MLAKDDNYTNLPNWNIDIVPVVDSVLQEFRPQSIDIEALQQMIAQVIDLLAVLVLHFATFARYLCSQPENHQELIDHRGRSISSSFAEKLSMELRMKKGTIVSGEEQTSLKAGSFVRLG